MSIVLTEEQLEVLYILLNDEHDPKYFFPHFEASCAELAENGLIRLLTRIQQKLKPTVEAPGLRAFLNHYGTSDVRIALKTHASRSGMTEEHWNLLSRVCLGNPVRAAEIDNELIAFDLVNLGYAISLFPSSGAVYYSNTREGKDALKEHLEVETT